MVISLENMDKGFRVLYLLLPVLVIFAVCFVAAASSGYDPWRTVIGSDPREIMDELSFSSFDEFQPEELITWGLPGMGTDGGIVLTGSIKNPFKMSMTLKSVFFNVNTGRSDYSLELQEEVHIPPGGSGDFRLGGDLLGLAGLYNVISSLSSSSYSWQIRSEIGGVGIVMDSVNPGGGF